jgi:hypothetical protein
MITIQATAYDITETRANRCDVPNEASAAIHVPYGYRWDSPDEQVPAGNTDISNPWRFRGHNYKLVDNLEYFRCFKTVGNFSDSMLWQQHCYEDEQPDPGRVYYRHDFKAIANIIKPIDGGLVFIVVGNKDTLTDTVASLCTAIQDDFFNDFTRPAVTGRA